jgi:DNA polymerase/3'-5' exonuclease PolX
MKLERIKPMNIDKGYIVRKVDNFNYDILYENQKSYDVKIVGGEAHCSCKGFKYRQWCKHSRWVNEVVAEDVKSYGRFTRAEIEEVMAIFAHDFRNNIHTQIPWVICGSYRRGAYTVGDIDLLIPDDNKFTVKQELEFFASYLHQIDAYGSQRVRGLMKTPRDRDIQIDVHICPKVSTGAHLLYFTGPKKFNIMLRKYAMERGYSLNEYGLYDNTTCLASINEGDILKALGLAYIEPQRRNFIDNLN